MVTQPILWHVGPMHLLHQRCSRFSPTRMTIWQWTQWTQSYSRIRPSSQMMMFDFGRNTVTRFVDGTDLFHEVHGCVDVRCTAVRDRAQQESIT